MTISRYKDNRDKEFEHENVISLKHFPYKLRKVAKYLLQMDKKVTIKQACEDINVNYSSIRSQISREKIKGNDFYAFIEAVSEAYLNSSLIAVDSATVDGALNGTARDREIYYKRINKLKEAPQVEITNNLSLTYAIQVNEGSNTDRREKGENSLIPYIPVKPK